MAETEGEKAMVGNAQKGGGWHGSLWRIAIWGVVVLLLLLVPLIAMQISDEWNWDLFDFVFAFVVLFGAGVTFELVARKADTFEYKAGVGVAVVTALLLVWVNAAVGIIGEDDGINLFYFGVLAVGLVGAFIARFEPQGMARTMFAMAIAQMAVPLIVFMIPNLRGILMEPPGLGGVIVLNAVFAMLFVGSGLLFRKAVQAQSPTDATSVG